MKSSSLLLPVLGLGFYFIYSSKNPAKTNPTKPIIKSIGYSQGKPFEISLTYIDGNPVEIKTADQYLKMFNAAKSENVILKINSGFRTKEEQSYLYDCYINCNCNNCNFAKKPGYSDHQSGKALDIILYKDVLEWLKNNANKFGFKNTIQSEPWHWEWVK